MTRFEILLPLFYNDGRQIEPEKFTATDDDLVNLFGATSTDLISRADAALYFAKKNGKNQVAIAAELNDSYLKLAKFKGEFIWHRHDNEDELFLVVQGNLRIKLRDGEIQLGPGECAVVPRGVDHLPIAEEEACVLLLEPKSTINTGHQRNQRTVTDLEWI